MSATEDPSRSPAPFEPGPDPLAVFEAWFTEAQGSEVMAESASLATVNGQGAPSIRVVLFRGFVRGAFAFYTNYRSRKARELEGNPRAALCFHWARAERQVRVEGLVSRCTRAESEAYFATRPRDSQLGAWASAQSSPLVSREALLAQLEVERARFGDGEVPCPPHWGGYRLDAERIELWQGAPSRLHDRFDYERLGDGGWSRVRLAP